MNAKRALWLTLRYDKEVRATIVKQVLSIEFDLSWNMVKDALDELTKDEPLE